MLSQLEEEYEALTQFLYMAPTGLAQICADGGILMANSMCVQLLMPLSRDGGMENIFTLLEDVAPDLLHRVNNYTADSGMVCEALHLHLKSGTLAKAGPQILSLDLLKLDSNQLMAVINDVTREVRREQELRLSESWFSAIDTGVTDYALIALDAKGCIENWNPGVARVTGFSQVATEGQSCSLFYPPDSLTQEQLLDCFAEADQNGLSFEEGWRVRADGSRFWGSCLISPLLGARRSGSALGGDWVAPTERGYSLIIRDMSEKWKAHEALRKAATTDHMMALANRRVFFDAAELEIKRWRRSALPLALLLVDVDDFKLINDTWGHLAGDAVLRVIAASLKATFRDVDVVARINGEEFAVLLTGTNLQGAQVVAERMCKNVAAQAVEFEGNNITVTVSAGIATVNETVSHIDMLMKHAEKALCAAKTAGRNQVESWTFARGNPAVS